MVGPWRDGQAYALWPTQSAPSPPVAGASLPRGTPSCFPLFTVTVSRKSPSFSCILGHCGSNTFNGCQSCHSAGDGTVTYPGPTDRTLYPQGPVRQQCSQGHGAVELEPLIIRTQHTIMLKSAGPSSLQPTPPHSPPAF